MKVYESAKVRNVGFFGHGGSGKTSLAEAFLFNAKATTRLGRVEDGNTVTDWEPEEISKTHSIGTGIASAEWHRTRINILDTPGGANFAADSRFAMVAADLALITVCAAGGVEVQTEKFWDYATDMGLPRFIFINKMDRERADYFKVLQEIQTTFKVTLTPLQIPIGKETSFTGVVDLLTGKAFSFANGKASPIDVPADMAAQVEEYRTKAIEAIAENDEDLMMAYLEGEELAPEAVLAALKEGIKSGEIVPVMCGSATKNIGVQPLMDLIAESGPSPLDRHPTFGVKPGTEEEVERKSEEGEPFSAIVFKTIIDRHAGRLSVMRIISGKATPDSTAFNPNQDTKERWGQLLKLFGKEKEAIDEGVVGDIIAVAKLKDTLTADTLCDDRAPVQYSLIKVPSPSISFSIQPKSQGDEEKITAGLQRLCEEDPTVGLRFDEQTKEFIIEGVGQGHLEITVEKLRRKFGVEVTISTPKVPYKETIRAEARARYRHKKQTGGRGQFGECELVLSPKPRGEGYEFVDKIVGGVIPRQYIPAVDKGVQDRLGRGVLAGHEIVDVEVRCVDGKFHPVDSSEAAFKMAGSMCTKKAVEQAKPCLLEPIMNLEITVPSENTGDVMGDLSSRRGRPAGIDTKGKNSVIKAQVPLAEVLRYEPDLRSMTSGQGAFTMEFSHYEEIPSDLAQKIIDAAKGDEEEEE
ncbi:MAG: elongation factor G [Candidatus Lernaella stagnicola]|nr:elongation factor G [Candidatus Lernaella stagnicola]